MSTRTNLDELLLHEAFVRRLARSLVRDEQRAEDLVQDTWVAALERAPNTHVRGWLGSVVRRIWSKELRGQERRHRRELEASRVEASELLDEAMALEESRRLVVETLFGLTESLRTCLLLRYFEGLPPRRIARRLDLPVETVKTRLQRGLGLLREALDKRHGGDRNSWMSAVTAIATPTVNGIGTGTLVIGGVAMGTMIKVSAAVLAAAACMYFVTRTQQDESPRGVTVEPPTAAVERPETTKAPVQFAAEEPATQTARRELAAEEPPAEATRVAGANVLRVVVEGITDEDARQALVTLIPRGEDGKRVAGIEGSWPCQGLTSEFDLDPIFARVSERDLRVGSMSVEVDHPLHLLERARIERSDGLVSQSGQTIHELRVTMSGTVFWPELTLTVRDANTRAHLQDVELHCIGTEFMNLRRQPGPGLPYSAIGRELSSPIALMGGHEADEPSRVGTVALQPGEGESPQVVELAGRSDTDRGVVVYARAPGYEWGRIYVDFSTGGERELLLGKGASLGLQLTNIQFERYAALGKVATLSVHQAGWGVGYVWIKPLDETLETEGLWLEGLEPGEFTVAVELGGEWSYRKRLVLLREELSLAAGETRELLLALPDPPAPPDRVSLGGVISFPAFDREEDVRLQLFQADWGGGDPDLELSLSEMQHVDGALPTWSFQLDDISVGTCQVHLLPFLKSWMIDVPTGGRDDVSLVIPELAELHVETVDARTGERIPLEKLRYIYKEEVPGRMHQIWSDQIWTGFEGEPGLFRVWTAPGTTYVGSWKIPSELGYGSGGKDLELVPGLQAARLELTPPYSFRIELRVDGAALPYDDGIYWDLHQGIHAVDHEGRASHVWRKVAYVSAPGVYEISFEGVGDDRFLPVTTRRVDVRAGETAEVIVELQRK